MNWTRTAPDAEEVRARRNWWVRWEMDQEPALSDLFAKGGIVFERIGERITPISDAHPSTEWAPMLTPDEIAAALQAQREACAVAFRVVAYKESEQEARDVLPSILAGAAADGPTAAILGAKGE